MAVESAKSRLAEFPDSPLWRDWYGPQDQAIIALARRDAAAVLALTDRIQPRNHQNSFVPVLRGEAQLQLGNGPAAATEIQYVIDYPGVFQDNQPTARIGLARAYTMAGDKARARNAYEDFFEFWKRADPDVPLLLQAKPVRETDVLRLTSLGKRNAPSLASRQRPAARGYSMWIHGDDDATVEVGQ